MNLDKLANTLPERFDEKIDSTIRKLMDASLAEIIYSKQDLDKPINEDETLREYLVDSEKEFHLPTKQLDSMDNKELTLYVKKIDSVWEGCFD